jgi:CRP/FNR family cyclic AMP-dependent transcriptional regulator
MRTADPTFLAQVPLFRGAPARALEIASQAAQLRTFEADTVLFREGDRGEVLYILYQGTVKLFKIDLEGHEKTLAILKPPEFFGEMALLGEGGRSATALCLRETHVYLLFKDDFERLLREYPNISLNVANTLSERLRGMGDEAQVLSYKDAQGRVAYVILRLYWGGHIDFSDTGHALLRLTHQELASLAGTSRETVTRALKALEEEGVISTRPKEVLIRDPNGLEEILHGVR